MWNALDFISPFSRDLDSCFHGFCTSVHWEEHVIAKHFGHEFGESREDIVVESSAAQSQSLGLLCQSFHEFRVAVALIHSAVGREEVKVMFSFLIMSFVSKAVQQGVVILLTGSQTSQPLALAKTMGSG